MPAYLLQTHEMLFDAHNHAFRVFGGIPRRGIYDNMRTAIDRVGRGKERDVNVRFMAMASHYLFEPEFCNPASGWEKGQVEKNVQDARHRLWQPIPRFPTLEALNDWLERRCKELWAQTPHGQMRGTIADIWADEAHTLMPVSHCMTWCLPMKTVTTSALISKQGRCCGASCAWLFATTVA